MFLTVFSNNVDNFKVKTQTEKLFIVTNLIQRIFGGLGGKLARSPLFDYLWCNGSQGAHDFFASADRQCIFSGNALE